MLTATEQQKIIWFLGWPAKTIIPGSTHYDQTIVTRMAALDPDTESVTRSLLLQLDNVRAQYTASTSRMKATKVGDIEINSKEHDLLGKEYRRLLKELAVLLDIPMLNNGNGRNVCVSI
jgi:hypothetical protein